MLLNSCIWLAIALVITLRSLAVYSHHFIQEEQSLKIFEQILSWFRFYKPGFSTTLGLVAFFLALVAFLDGSIPWTIGNLVFGMAAFINFQEHKSFKLFSAFRAGLRSRLGACLVFWVIPILLFGGLLGLESLGNETGRSFSGLPFSYTGAYLLAFVFLAMKLEVWGTLSHEAWPYLAGVMVWDTLLLLGAVLDGNTPFIVLESYAFLLDATTIYLVKRIKAVKPLSVG
jgi:hypothetical protein